MTSTTAAGIRDWIWDLFVKCALSSILTAEYTPTGEDASHASQAEFTPLQGEMTIIQEKIVALGIATLVNEVLTAVR